MWTHAPWQGRFLPHPLPPKERLRAYATWCTAVEGNTTFYATPARSTVEMWAQQTDTDFRFVMKLPRTITHERRLQSAEWIPFDTVGRDDVEETAQGWQYLATQPPTLF